MTKLFGCLLLLAVLVAARVASLPVPVVADSGCTFGWDASQPYFSMPVQCPHLAVGLSSLKSLLF